MQQPHKQAARNQLVLGVDPGTRLTGYALLHQQGQSLILVEHGVLRLSEQAETHAGKLAVLYQRLDQLITRYKPHALAVESPFAGANIQSALKLGRVQGVVLACAVKNDLKVAEFAPRTVKQRVTGRGASAKHQVAYMLHKLVRGTPPPEEFETDDASDALAVAVCYALSGDQHIPHPLDSHPQGGGKRSSTGGRSSWKKIWLAQQGRDDD